MDKGVSKKQFSLLIILIPMVFKLAMYPSMMAKVMANNVWLGVLTALILEFAQLFIIVEVHKNGGMDGLKNKIGNVWYAVITVPLLAIFGIRTIVFAAEAIGYVASFLFYNIKSFNVAVMLFLAIGFIAAKGSTSIGRIAEITLFLIPIILILGFGFGKIEFDFSHVLPIMADGFTPIATGVDRYILWAFDLTPFLFFNITKKSKKPLIFTGAIISIVVTTGLFVLFIATYGGSAHIIKNAFAMLATFNVVTTEIGSLDWPSITIWVIMAIISLAAKVYSSSRVLETFKVKRQVGCVVVAVPLCLITGIVFYNWDTVVTFATSWVRYLVVGLDVLLPIIYLVILKLKKKNKAEGAVSYEKVD